MPLNIVDIYSAPVAERGIVMRSSVRLSAHEYVQTNSPNFLHRLPVTTAWTSSGGAAICYVLPVLWIASCLILLTGPQ